MQSNHPESESELDGDELGENLVIGTIVSFIFDFSSP